MQLNYKKTSSKEKSRAYYELIQNPGWSLLQQTFNPVIYSKIVDASTKEQFLYEAIRFQVLQEVFNTPRQFISNTVKGKEDYNETSSLLEGTWEKEWQEQWNEELTDEELDEMTYEEFEELMSDE